MNREMLPPDRGIDARQAVENEEERVVPGHAS